MVAPRIAEASTRAIDLALNLLKANTPHKRYYKTDRDFATDVDYRVEREVRRLLRELTRLFEPDRAREPCVVTR